MNFGSVFLQLKVEKNLAAKQLEKGLAKTNLNKDNLSKHLEELLNAEKKAIDGKLCLHSKRDPPRTILNDLTQDVKQAKAYEQMLAKRNDRKFAAVVEHCFSGMRFKLRLENESCYIALNLLGVKTPAADKNQPALMEFANDAHAFAKEQIFQREVQVELFNADKRGTFFGTIQMPNKSDFSLKLLEEGHAKIHVLGNERRLPSNMSQLEDMESIARKKELGVWSKSMRLISQQSQGWQQYSFLD